MILAIETATPVCSVALIKDETVLAELNLQTGNTHSGRLMPQIASLAEMTGTDPAEIEALAVSIGPGSFTGLRIGITTAKTLSYAWDKPIVGIPTLEALAFNCPAADGWVSAMLDAQKGRVYEALYHWENGCLTEMRAIRIVTVEQVLAELANQKSKVMVVGESVRDYLGQIDLIDNLTAAPEHGRMPRAAAVGLLAWRKYHAGQAVTANELNPLYVRRPEAEELWEKRCRSDHEAGI